MKECKVCKKEITSKFANTYCSNSCKFSDPEYNKSRVKVREKLDRSKKVVCNIDGKQFFDIDNRSGVLSRHLKKLNVTFEEALDYYTLVDNQEKKKETWKCKYCDWQTKDTKNKSGCVTSHLKTKHNVDPTIHVKNFPEDLIMWTSSKVVTNKRIRSMFFEENEKSHVSCFVCGEKMKRITSTHLALHDMSMEEYRKKYGLEDETLSSEDLRSLMKKNYYSNFDKINKDIKSSSYEKELCAFLDSHEILYETCNRTLISPYELDVYIPEKKVAIEINGLYWHSEISGRKLKDYHLKKTESCEKLGIRLVQIFDDEWRNKKSIVISKLSSILGLQKQSIYARNCEVRRVKSEEKIPFLRSYHIQGEDRSKHAYGLYYQGELVSLMTFCELRTALGSKKSKGFFELSRYCSSKRVVGGASKLFSAILKEVDPDLVISYADRRFTSYSLPSVYDSLGFVKGGVTKPNYWYTLDYSKKLHRYNFAKHRLIKHFEADKKKTEFEIMEEMGYDRVWDCGNVKYKWTKK